LTKPIDKKMKHLIFVSRSHFLTYNRNSIEYKEEKKINEMMKNNLTNRSI